MPTLPGIFTPPGPNQPTWVINHQIVLSYLKKLPRLKKLAFVELHPQMAKYLRLAPSLFMPDLEPQEESSPWITSRTIPSDEEEERLKDEVHESSRSEIYTMDVKSQYSSTYWHSVEEGIEDERAALASEAIIIKRLSSVATRYKQEIPSLDWMFVGSLPFSLGDYGLVESPRGELGQTTADCYAGHMFGVQMNGLMRDYI